MARSVFIQPNVLTEPSAEAETGANDGAGDTIVTPTPEILTARGLFVKAPEGSGITATEAIESAEWSLDLNTLGPIIDTVGNVRVRVKVSFVYETRLRNVWTAVVKYSQDGGSNWISLASQQVGGGGASGPASQDIITDPIPGPALEDLRVLAYLARTSGTGAAETGGLRAGFYVTQILYGPQVNGVDMLVNEQVQVL